MKVTQEGKNGQVAWEMEPRQGTLALVLGPVLLLMPSSSLTVPGREAWWANICTGANTFQFHSQFFHSLAG